jgi:hypothetical protein
MRVFGGGSKGGAAVVAPLPSLPLFPAAFSDTENVDGCANGKQSLSSPSSPSSPVPRAASLPERDELGSGEYREDKRSRRAPAGGNAAAGATAPGACESLRARGGIEASSVVSAFFFVCSVVQLPAVLRWLQEGTKEKGVKRVCSWEGAMLKIRQRLYLAGEEERGGRKKK